MPLFNATECFVAAPSLAPSRPQRTRIVQDATLPFGCVLLSQNTTVEAVFNTISSNVSCGAGATQFWGQAQCNITGVTATLAMDVPAGRVTISLQGPAAVWLGVAFNATSMAQLPYAIIVDGNGAVTERTLGDHDAGTLLSPQVVAACRPAPAEVACVHIPCGSQANNFPESATQLAKSPTPHLS